MLSEPQVNFSINRFSFHVARTHLVTDVIRPRGQHKYVGLFHLVPDEIVKDKMINNSFKVSMRRVKRTVYPITPLHFHFHFDLLHKNYICLTTIIHIHTGTPRPLSEFRF